MDQTSGPPIFSEEQVSVPVLSLVDDTCGEKGGPPKRSPKKDQLFHTPKAGSEFWNTCSRKIQQKQKVQGWYLIANNMPLATSILGFVGTGTTISNRRDEANNLGLAVSQYSQYAMWLLPENRMVPRLFWQKWFTFYYRLIHHWRHVSVSKKQGHRFSCKNSFKQTPCSKELRRRTRSVPVLRWDLMSEACNECPGEGRLVDVKGRNLGIPFPFSIVP